MFDMGEGVMQLLVCTIIMLYTLLLGNIYDYARAMCVTNKWLYSDAGIENMCVLRVQTGINHMALDLHCFCLALCLLRRGGVTRELGYTTQAQILQYLNGILGWHCLCLDSPWSEKEQCNQEVRLVMRWCLTGKAADYYSNMLDRQPDQHYHQVESNLAKRYGRKDLVENRMAEYQTTRQNRQRIPG